MVTADLFKVIALIAAATASLTAFSANADDYLKMIEGEAEDLSLDKSGQIVDGEEKPNDSSDVITRKDWKWEGDLEGDALPPGLAQDEFATLLKQRFYGTFVFYRKLNTVDQKTVYYRYTQASDAGSVANLDAIRQDILDQLKK